MNKFIITKESGASEEIIAHTFEPDRVSKNSSYIFYADNFKKQPIAYLSRIQNITQN